MATESNPDSVSFKTSAHNTWMDDSKLPRTLMGGTKAMKLASTDYLMKNPFESTDAYNNRLERSTLLNAYRKTAQFLGGQVFQSDIIFGDGVPEVFIEMSKKIDFAGNNINVFSKRSFVNGTAKGVTHFLVDSPSTDGEELTVEQEREQGIRPFLKEIRPEDVIGWRVSEDGRLAQIRIKETVTKDIGKYGSEEVNRIRVFNGDGTWELHILGEEGETVSTKTGTLSIEKMPIVSFIPGDETSVVTGETPLMDLAELNADHWRSSSDQTNILHVARVPILFGRKIDIEQMITSTSVMVTSDEEDSDMKYIEIVGASIAAGQTNLTETEAKMALYGLQQLIPRSGSMTATEKALTSAESNSSLGTWATEFEDILQQAFEIMGEYIGVIFPENGVSVNREYNFGIADPQELAMVLEAHDKGILSAQACFSEFRRRGTFDEHLKWDDMEADLEQEKRDNIEMSQLAGSTFGEDDDTEEDD